MPPFPTTPILDDFNRADENPLSGGGNWAGPLWSSDPQLAVVSNQAKFASGTSGYSYWNSWTESSAGFEVYVTAVTLGQIELYLCASNPNTTTVSGYDFVVTTSVTQIYRSDSGTYTLIGSGGTFPVNGDQIGFSRSPTGLLIGWINGANVAQVVDTTYTSGLFAVGVKFSGIIDNFGGGRIPIIPPVDPNFVYMRKIEGKKTL